VLIHELEEDWRSDITGFLGKYFYLDEKHNQLLGSLVQDENAKLTSKLKPDAGDNS